MRKFLISAADSLGIQSAIFNNIVWGFGTWKERSPASSPHLDHVHGGINKWGAANVTRAMVDAALREWSGQEEDVPTQAQWDAFITNDLAWKNQMNERIEKMEGRVEEAWNNTRITDPRSDADPKVIGIDVYLRDIILPAINDG